MKINLVCLLLIFCCVESNAKTILVGQGQQYTTIQPAINAALTNDTVKILPGTYDAAISLSKNIIVLGSGYENTLITSSNNPTLTMSAGKIMWLTINSTGGNGIFLTGGLVKNVVIRGCTMNGIYTTTGTSSVSNCVIKDNSQYGIYVNDTYPFGEVSVMNCISYNNGNSGFRRRLNGNLLVSFSNGSLDGATEGPGCINQNPQFMSATDLHLQLTSPCWDTGSTAINDPDGTRSDMGYFGGNECPIYPVVIQIKIVPQQNGEIQIQAIGMANY